MTVVVSGGSILGLRQAPTVDASWRFMPQLAPYRSTPDLLGDYAAIYATQPNVQTCVSFRARNFAHVGLHAFRRESETNRERLDGSHELSQVIAMPNPYMSRYRYFEALESDLQVFGNHYSVKMRGESGRLELWRVPPQSIRVADGGSWMYPEAYTLGDGKEAKDIPASSVFHVHTYNAKDQRYGISPLEALRRILNEEEQAGRYRENFWKNAARIEGVLTHPQRLSTEAKDYLTASWQALNSGEAASGRTAILEEGMKFETTSFNARDSQYIEARKLAREEVAAALHIPPPMVGVLDHATFSNIREQHRMLYQDCLGPEFALVEDEFMRSVVPDVEDTEGVYVEFNIREKLQGSFEEESEALMRATGAPYMLRSEARGRMNLPDVPGMEQPIVPLNVLNGGQAAPQDSAPKASTNGHTAIGANT